MKVIMMRLREQNLQDIQNNVVLTNRDEKEMYDIEQFKLDSKYKILLVDDDKGVLDILEMILKKSGFQCTGFDNAEKALEELKNNDTYNIIVSDYFMEPVHGDEFVRQVRMFNVKIHILLLTGFKDRAPALDTLKRLNIQGYCEKSNNFDQLLLWLYAAVRVLEQNKDIYELVEKTTVQNQEITQLHNNLEDTYSGLVETLRLTVDAKDEYTKGHSDRVSYYSTIIGHAMNLTPEEIEILRIGGYFHDIGKIGVKDQIINKDSKLTDQEFDEIRQHPEKGYSILVKNPIFSKILPLIKSHHEKLDGTGYPLGLKGDEIPLLVRITSISDAFDAMMSKRSYRDELGIDKAVSELRRCSGTQFDPEVVEVFVRLIEKEWEKIWADVGEINRKLGK